MDRVEVFRSNVVEEIERAQRFLRNADLQSWRSGGGPDPLLVTVRPADADDAREVLTAVNAFSAPLASAGPPEDQQPWWRQPGTIPILVAATVLLIFVDYRFIVMFAIVAVPLLGVRVYATKRRGEDRFAGPNPSQDRPRPRHRDWRMGSGPDHKP